MDSAATPSGDMRNVGLLSATQAIVSSQQGLIMAVGALVGVVLAPDPRLATLPTTTMIVGLALAAAPAAWLSHRLGRKPAFLLGVALAISGALLAALAIGLANFVLFAIALAVSGSAAAFGQQYRFAAADSMPPEKKGKAVSWVLAGGVAAAFIGPGLSWMGRTWVPGAEYAGSFIGMAGLSVLAILILLQTRLPKAEKHLATKSQRSFFALLKAPEHFVPILTGMASYGLMTFVMVAAPLAMVVICGHPKEAASFAIQWHILAMFAPSFFTGAIIARLGVRLVTGIGLALIAGCAVVALQGTEVWHFDLALILLGLGWNFGFIGSTTLLAQGYRPEDAARVQALNEQLVFGVMAIASISSGVLLQTIGWQAVNILAIPVATGAIVLLAWTDFRSRTQPA